MKTDAYTKVILTIIACCLSCIVLQNLEIIPKAQASTNEVNVPAPQSTLDVRIVDWAGLYYNPIPVTVK